MRTKDQVLADINPLRVELEKIESVERKAENAKLLGKCFRYRNSYGGGSPSWWLYAKVTGSDGWRPTCFSFELTSRDRIEITVKENRSLHTGNGWQEITAKMFAAEWRKVQKRIAGLKP